VTLEQLALDLGHEPVEDGLADLDLEHAERVLAEQAPTTRPLLCRCIRRSGHLVDEFGDLRCVKCGRTW
jgi:hypothetical protein